jgi:hypothetical protein
MCYCESEGNCNPNLINLEMYRIMKTEKRINRLAHSPERGKRRTLTISVKCPRERESIIFRQALRDYRYTLDHVHDILCELLLNCY